MSKPLISVIVPIYNVEKYLDACLKSIQDQTFSDFEVLLVNDGTPDNSTEIANRYVQNDDRFVLFNNKNQGLSGARNFGLERAKGDYIAFIDSDDRINKEYLEKLYNAIKDADADVAICNFRLYYLNTGKEKPSGSFFKDGRIYDRDKALKALLCDLNMRFYVWNKLWKKSLFFDNNIRMTKMYYEDIVVSSQFFTHIKKAVTVNYDGYIYTRAFSKYVEVSMSKSRINDYINTVPVVRKYLLQMGLYDSVKWSFFWHIFHVFFSVPGLVVQARKELDDGIWKNIFSGMGRILKCRKMSVEEIEEMLREDSVK